MPISSAVDASAVARVVGIDTIFKNLRGESVNFLPQRIAVVGQGATSVTYNTTKAQYTSALTVGQTYGFGSPVHLAALQLLPVNGDGIGTIPMTIYPLVDDGSGVASAGDITPSGSSTIDASYIVRVNNIDSKEFVIPASASVSIIIGLMITAINAVLEMPVIATDGTTVLNTVSKWKGTSSNDIFIEVIGSTTAGSIFTITQHVGGLVNPDVDIALTQVGNVWETMFLNCMDISDLTTLSKFKTFGDGRWGALVKKPCVVFTGNPAKTPSAAITIPDARKTDKINSQLVSPGSTNLPFVTAARQISRIVVLANNNPPHDYGSQKATNLVPGDDGDQWLYTDRDTAVKGGSSTIEVKDGVVNLSDIITFYHPTGDTTPAYRYVVDIVKLMNIIYNTNLIFETADWDGAPLIPDNQPTTNRSAKKPKTAVTAVASLIDSLANEAIISDPINSKKSIVASINGSNPKRLDLSFTVQLSGNTNIISIDLNFGFFFG